MTKLVVSEVQLILPDGVVKHFVASAGDVIVANVVDIFYNNPTERIKYYTLVLTPCESTKGFDIL